MTLFKLGIQPVANVDVKTGVKANVDFFLLVEGPRLCINGYVAFPTIKWCGPIPCGFKWDQARITVEIKCLDIHVPGIGSGLKVLMFSLPPKPDGDTTPPEPGEVEASQRSGMLKVSFPNFLDTETDIVSSRILVGAANKGREYHDLLLNENPALWEGALQQPPPVGTKVLAKPTSRACPFMR